MIRCAPIGGSSGGNIAGLCVVLRTAHSVVARGNALLQSLFAGPMVLIKDPLRDRPKVVEPLKVAQEILQVYFSTSARSIF